MVDREWHHDPEEYYPVFRKMLDKLAAPVEISLQEIFKKPDKIISLTVEEIVVPAEDKIIRVPSEDRGDNLAELEKYLRSIKEVTVVADESVLRPIASLVSIERETKKNADWSTVGGIKVAQSMWEEWVVCRRVGRGWQWQFSRCQGCRTRYCRRGRIWGYE